jgi:uncharacterized protein YcfJ
MNISMRNTTTNKTLLIGAVLLSATLAASSANAGGYAYNGNRSSQAVYDYARVLSAEPIVRYVTVRTPVRECWEETEYYTVNHHPAHIGGKTILGAIIGGVVGHQFGGGSGKRVATVAGSLIGASVANAAAHRNAGYGSTEYSRPVKRCETHYQSHEEERIDGYRVIYSYRGQKYSTRMPDNPGKRLRVRVDIRPAA